MPAGCHHPRGFTLIEQMLALALAAVLVAMAVPALGRLRMRTGVQVVSDELVQALRTARQVAVFRDTVVMLCPSPDGHHCGHAGDWPRGWLVARDHDRDGQPDGPPLASGTSTTHGVAIIGSRARIHVRFRPDGGAPGSNMSLLVCRRGHVAGARRVILSATGRVRASNATPAQAGRCRQQRG